MSEGDFVGYYFNNLQSYHPGITKYYGIVKKVRDFKTIAHAGDTIYFIWREEFEKQGDLDIGERLHRAKEFTGNIIDLSLNLANHSDPGNPYKASFEKELKDAEKDFYEKCMAVDKEADYDNQISLIGAALWDMYRSHKILLTDVHLDNIGYFPDRGWAITDPGQNYFLNQKELETARMDCEELS